MTNKTQLTTGLRIALIANKDGEQTFVPGDADFAPLMIGKIIDIDTEATVGQDDIEVEFDNGLEAWGNSTGVIVIPDDVVSVDNRLYRKEDSDDAANGRAGLFLSPYDLPTQDEPAETPTPQAGEVWTRADTGGQYLVVNIEDLSDDSGDTLRFVNMDTGEFYKLNSLFGRKGQDRFVPPAITLETDDAAADDDDDDADNDVDTDDFTPQAGQVWKRGDRKYLVVDTETDSDGNRSTNDLRFLNLATGKVYSRSSLFGRRGEGRFTFVSDNLDVDPQGAYDNADVDPDDFTAGMKLRRTDTDVYYIVGDIDVDDRGRKAAGTLRAFNLETGKVYKRSSLMGRRGHDRFVATTNFPAL